MSKSDDTQQSQTDQRSKREKLRELANSDRPTAPVYEKMYRERYEEDP